MTDSILLGFLALNTLLILGLISLHLKLSRIEGRQKETRNEVKYFEYIEDNSGALKNSRRYVIKGQIHYDGLPIGEQFVVSEQVIEEFSWDKFAKLREEILLPMAKLSIDTASLIKGVGGAAKGVAGAVVKGIKRKAS